MTYIHIVLFNISYESFFYSDQIFYQSVLEASFRALQFQRNPCKRKELKKEGEDEL